MRGAAMALACLLPALAHGAFIDQSRESVRLMSEVEYRADLDDAVPFEAVEAMTDGWVSQSRRPFEGTGKPVRLWARFEIPPAGEDRRVFILTGSWERLEYYFVRDGRLVGRALAGTLVPTSQRTTDVGMTPPLLVPGFVAIDAPAHARTLGYVRVSHDNRFFAMQGLRFSIWKEDDVREEARRDALVQGLFLGAMLLLVVYNVALYLLDVRDAAPFYYALSLATGCVMWLGLSGLSFAAFWPEHPAWDFYLLFLTLSPGIFVFAQFMRRYLDTPRRLPELDRQFLWLAICCAALPPLIQSLRPLVPQILLERSAFPEFINAMTVSVPMFAALAAMHVAVVAVRKGLPSARLFLVAILCAGVGAVLSGLPLLGAPWGWLVHAYHVGMVLMGTILTIGLGIRMRDLRAELADRKIREARLEGERLQAEVASKHKSDFLANMSHELRTPLNAVIGFSDVMATGMAGPLTDKQREFVGDIRDSGRHLLSLINDILDLSKIEAGRMELDVTRFDVPAAMANAIALVRTRAERHGIHLSAETGPEVGPYEGDERKFKQIVLNLLTNAVKFTPEGGSVTLGAQRMNGAYVFTVTDTGVGIAPEDQQAIFEEFKQVGDVERKAEGTGLGLALTKRLVELHGGASGSTASSAEARPSLSSCRLPRRTRTQSRDEERGLTWQLPSFWSRTTSATASSRAPSSSSAVTRSSSAKTARRRWSSRASTGRRWSSWTSSCRPSTGSPRWASCAPTRRPRRSR
jgi:signal transduction histidine kinase